MGALDGTATFKNLAASVGEEIFIRTAIHVGDVYFGAIGSELRHDITLVGDTVNVAARVAACAERFEVLATQDVMNEVRGEFQSSARPPVRVKGKSAPLALQVLHGAASDRDHDVRRRSKPPFFAGRKRELARLRALLGEAMAGRRRTEGIVEKRDTKKSCLLSPVIDNWIERPSSSERGASLADGYFRERLLGTVVRFLDQRLKERPPLYILENLHSADGLTLELIQRLTLAIEGRPCLFLCTFRPEPGLEGMRGCLEEIEIGNLSLQDSRELVAHPLGADTVDEAVGAFL